MNTTSDDRRFSVAPARLLLADDHELIREGMRAMLSREPDLEVIGEAADGQESLEFCRLHRPDLVLMDLRMPRMDGIEATRTIREECPATSVLVVTIHESPEYLPDALAAGAAGYVLKDATRYELLEAIRRVLGGESPLNQERAAELRRRLAGETAPIKLPLPAPTRDRWEEPLTVRDLEALRRSLGSGNIHWEIARELVASSSKANTCA